MTIIWTSKDGTMRVIDDGAVLIGQTGKPGGLMHTANVERKIGPFGQFIHELTEKKEDNALKDCESLLSLLGECRSFLCRSVMDEDSKARDLLARLDEVLK